MKKILVSTLALVLLTVFFLLNATAQQSDYALQQSFEQRYRALLDRVDAARTIGELDTLKTDIDLLDTDFDSHRAFLDKALYPQTYDESMSVLRKARSLTYDRVYLIQSSGVRIAELETKIDFMSARIDSLTSQRNSLFAELAEAKKSNASLRDVIKRLSTNLVAKDRLVTALVDSIFLPYGKDVSQLGDAQKEAIANRLEKSNITARVYDIANDNVKFLGVTQLQGKDYANLIDQYAQFKSKWSGLGEKINAVSAAPQGKDIAVPEQSGKGKTEGGKGTGTKTAPVVKPHQSFSLSVDSVVTLWHDKLAQSFWTALAKDLSANQVQLAPFNDGPSFSSSLRSYISAMSAAGTDATPFVDNVWKARIDKEWREALSKDDMLGKTEYASLDKLVSELKTDRFDFRIYLYAALAIAIVAGIWWYRSKKGKEKPAETAA